MSSHYHVATGLAGYGPDAADTDGFATFDTLGSALDYARDELAAFADMAHEGSHAAADAGDYEQAWLEVCRVETLDMLRANLDPIRKQAPLYVDDDAAYAALQETQAADFPHDVSHNTRLYLWECDDDECEAAADDDDDKPCYHVNGGEVVADGVTCDDCGSFISNGAVVEGEAPDTEGERFGLKQARALLDGTAGYEAPAEAWARRVDSETLAAMLSAGTGSSQYDAAKREWERRNPKGRPAS